MRRVMVLAVLLVMLGGVAWGWDDAVMKAWPTATALSTYTESGYWQEDHCAICGKALKEWHSGSPYLDTYLATGSTSLSWYNPASEPIYSLGYTFSLTVCGDCKSKYGGDLDKILKPIADKWLEDRITENIDKREENQRKELIQKTDQLKAKVRELQDALDEIKQDTAQ